MSTGIQAQSRTLGLAGCLFGLLAILAALLPPLLTPSLAPAPRAEPVAASKPHTLKGRVLEKLTAPRKEEAKPAPADAPPNLQVIATGLALLAIALAAVALIRREEKLYAAVAAALGTGTLAFQVALLFAGAILAILVLSALLGQADAGFPPWAILAGGIVILASVAVFGFGLVSPWLLVLVIAGAIAILGVLSLLGFW